MKKLTINPKVFKHQDQTKLKIGLFENDSKVSLDSNSDYQFKIKNSSGYLKSETLTIEDNRLVLTTDKLKDLPPDAYSFEVWENEDSIYPSDSYGYFKITKNVSEVDGETIPVITIEDFEKRFDEAVKNAKGDTGERGADGKDGRDGVNGKDGINGTNGRDGVDGKNGQDGKDGKSAYQIWLDLGNSGTEQDFINSLKATQERHAPTGYTLDTSTKPWTVWFDNGCGFQMPNWWNNKAFYTYGADNTVTSRFDIYEHPRNIIKVSKGVITPENFKNKEKLDANYSSYWDEKFIVLNPIRNRNDYDWSNVKFNDMSDVNRQKWIARTLYELGIWSGETFESFGAVRKAGN